MIVIIVIKKREKKWYKGNNSSGYLYTDICTYIGAQCLACIFNSRLLSPSYIRNSASTLSLSLSLVHFLIVRA